MHGAKHRALWLQIGHGSSVGLKSTLQGSLPAPVRKADMASSKLVWVLVAFLLRYQTPRMVPNGAPRGMAYLVEGREILKIFKGMI